MWVHFIRLPISDEFRSALNVRHAQPIILHRLIRSCLITPTPDNRSYCRSSLLGSTRGYKFFYLELDFYLKKKKGKNGEKKDFLGKIKVSSCFFFLCNLNLFHLTVYKNCYS